MCDRRHSALLTVIVPMVVGEMVRAYGIDEKTAAEKKTSSNSLVQASEFKQALDIFLQNMKGTAFDYEIAAIDETPLMDVFAANLSETLADKKEKED